MSSKNLSSGCRALCSTHKLCACFTPSSLLAGCGLLQCRLHPPQLFPPNPKSCVTLVVCAQFAVTGLKIKLKIISLTSCLVMIARVHVAEVGSLDHVAGIICWGARGNHWHVTFTGVHTILLLPVSWRVGHTWTPESTM